MSWTAARSASSTCPGFGTSSGSSLRGAARTSSTPTRSTSRDRAAVGRPMIRIGRTHRVAGRAPGGRRVMAEPRQAAARSPRPRPHPNPDRRVPAGAHELATRPHLVLVCARYEGVDERVRSLVDLELSISDYVLTGGELPALVVIDAVIRLLPGAIDDASTTEESFAAGLLEYPQYTRPPSFR